MENKKTKKVFFNELMAVVGNSEVDNKQELQDFITHELELLENKAANRKSGNTKKAKENKALADLIFQELQTIGKTTITDLLKQSETLADYITEDGKALSNQKITAIIKPYIKTVENPLGVVERIVDKKTVYYAIVGTEI